MMLVPDATFEREGNGCVVAQSTRQCLARSGELLGPIELPNVVRLLPGSMLLAAASGAMK